MFQRGFKAWCESIALQIRKDLGLEPYDPLNPQIVAEHLRIKVLSPEDVSGLDQNALKRLVEGDPDSWSAVTITIGSTPVIILNSAHSPARRASSLAHELAHIIIGHAPSQTGISPDGMLLSAYDRTQEDEANWLAGCLLLPREACLNVKRMRYDRPSAARRYGVSQDMLQFRLNMSGVERQMHFLARRRTAQVSRVSTSK